MQSARGPARTHPTACWEPRCFATPVGQKSGAKWQVLAAFCATSLRLENGISIAAKEHLPFSYVGKPELRFGSLTVAQLQSCATIAIRREEGADDVLHQPARTGEPPRAESRSPRRQVVPRGLRTAIARVARTLTCMHTRASGHHRWHIDGIDGSTPGCGRHSISPDHLVGRTGGDHDRRSAPAQGGSFKDCKGIKDCRAAACSIFVNFLRSMSGGPVYRENSGKPRQPGELRVSHQDGDAHATDSASSRS